MCTGGWELSCIVRANPTTWLTTELLLLVVSLVHALSLFISGDEGSGFSALSMVETENERAANGGARMAPATVLRSIVLFAS